MKALDIYVTCSGHLCSRGSCKLQKTFMGIYENSGHLIIVEINVNLGRYLEMLWEFMNIVDIKS